MLRKKKPALKLWSQSYRIRRPDRQLRLSRGIVN